MALGDTDDLACSEHGHQNPVVLYCHTCQVLLCPRCVSHGPAGEEPVHKHHTYLELQDAHDMFKADLTKLVGKLSDELQQKKTIRVELQNCIQKLKIELLRRKAVLRRRSTGFQDTVKMREAEFCRCLESVIQPAIERNEQHYNDIDYDIVSGNGLIGTAESLQNLPARKCVSFLRSFNSLRKLIEQHILKISSLCSFQDELHELQDFLLISLNFHKERKLLSQAFLCPQKDVTVPQVLRDWSTIGSTSVSVVWRCSSNVQNVDAFLLYYRPLFAAEKKRRPPLSVDPAELASLSDADLRARGFSHIRVHRFVPKRSHAVIRDLLSATDYVLVLFAVNRLARSAPSVFFFQTASSIDVIGRRTLSRRRPVGLSLCDRLMLLTVRIFRVMLGILVFVYIATSALLLVVYRDAFYTDLCHVLNLMELSEISQTICPAIDLRTPAAAAKESSYLVWLYDMFGH